MHFMKHLTSLISVCNYSSVLFLSHRVLHLTFFICVFTASTNTLLCMCMYEYSTFFFNSDWGYLTKVSTFQPYWKV